MSTEIKSSPAEFISLIPGYIASRLKYRSEKNPKPGLVTRPTRLVFFRLSVNAGFTRHAPLSLLSLTVGVRSFPLFYFPHLGQSKLLSSAPPSKPCTTRFFLSGRHLFPVRNTTFCTPFERALGSRDTVALLAMPTMRASASSTADSSFSPEGRFRSGGSCETLSLRPTCSPIDSTESLGYSGSSFAELLSPARPNNQLHLVTVSYRHSVRTLSLQAQSGPNFSDFFVVPVSLLLYQASK
ncbi:unnamed protein product [Protopolystoma xenopodis]|uniref:Uncharacterized protein n=1 Tax=Protopolystoma xenopodis TaxID=117903 RepID=A0A3S5CUJ5_9PLAT|nr:unnamed protein product [Protopolystoma xenopodis]